MFKCNVCEYQTRYKNRLIRHIRFIHNIKNKWFKCNLCRFKSKDIRYLIRHKYNHNKLNNDLKQYKQNIHNIKYFNCDLCEFKTKYNYNLKQHKRNKHDINVKWFNCDLCDYKSKSNSDLKRHKQQIHDIDVKWFNCNLCDYKTKSNSHLTRHISSIHNVGKFNCNFCNKNTNIKLISYTDVKIKKKLKICRNCYNKITGKDSRIELKMSNYLDKEFGMEFLIASDSRIYGNKCYNYRPDKMYASPNLIIHIECDEQQHNNSHYEYSCEEKRLSDIYDEFCGKQYVIIRWNPHNYKSKIKKLLIDEKLKLLLDTINYIKTHKFKIPMMIIYMFYDLNNPKIAKRIPFLHIKCDDDLKKIK